LRLFSYRYWALARMESVAAAARTRLHFQSFGTTAGLHDHETNARLVHAFYRASGVDRLTKYLLT